MLRNHLILTALVLLLAGCVQGTAPANTLSTPEAALNPDIAATASSLPLGVQFSKWRGVPVMPGARAGAEAGGEYTYTVAAGPSDIEMYYARALADGGWTYEGLGEVMGEAHLVFLRTAQSLVVSMWVGDGYTLITLTLK